MQLDLDTAIADLGLHPRTRNDLGIYWYTATNRYRSMKKIRTDFAIPPKKFRNQLAKRVSVRMVMKEWEKDRMRGLPRYCYPTEIKHFIKRLMAFGMTHADWECLPTNTG